MIPELYNNVHDVTEILYGRPLCYLADATSCIVSETLNGEFTLSMTYPVGGSNWEELQTGRIIVAKASELDDAIDPTQPFTIKSVQRDLNGNISVTAEHISYRLSSATLSPITGITLNTVFALRSYLNANVINGQGFVFYGTDTTAAQTGLSTDRPRSVRDLLFNGNDSAASIWQIEMRYNRQNVAMETDRGINRGLVIRYGSNLEALTEKHDICDIPAFIHPFVKMKNASNEDVYIDRFSTFAVPWNSPASPRPLVHVSSVNTEQELVQTVDLTEAMQRTLRWNSQPQTAEKVLSDESWFNAAAYTWAKENLADSILPPSLTVKYVDLARTTDGAGLAVSPTGVGDIVTVQVPQYGIDTTREVVGIKYNVLLGHNDSITVGTTKDTFASYLANLLKRGALN